MKKLIATILLSAFLVACGSDDKGGSKGNVVTSPLQLSCINGETYCNSNNYRNHPGFTPYNGLYNSAYDYSRRFIQQGLCGCPSGYSPTYNDAYGLGCVANTNIQIYSATVSNWSYAGGYGFGFYTATFYYTPAPQIGSNYNQQSNIPNNTYHQATCQRNITQSCFLDQANSCGSQSSCRPTHYNSNLGVCTRN